MSQKRKFSWPRKWRSKVLQSQWLSSDLYSGVYDALCHVGSCGGCERFSGLPRGIHEKEGREFRHARRYRQTRGANERRNKGDERYRGEDIERPVGPSEALGTEA